MRSIVNVEGNVSLGDCRFSGKIVVWAASEYVASGHETIVQQVHEMGTQSQPERFFYAALRLADPASTHRHASELVELSTTESMADRMAQLDVPCTFIAGVPNGLDQRSLELLDGAGVRTVRVEPAGHWVYVDQPEVCAEIVAELAESP